MSLSGEEEGKRVERWKGAADAFHFDKSQTLPLIMMRMMMSMIMYVYDGDDNGLKRNVPSLW